RRAGGDPVPWSGAARAAGESPDGPDGEPGSGSAPDAGRGRASAHPGRPRGHRGCPVRTAGSGDAPGIEPIDAPVPHEEARNHPSGGDGRAIGEEMMGTKETVASRAPRASDTLAALRRQYGCGPVELSGSANALYERHLLFDNVADPATAGARERYEAL